MIDFIDIIIKLNKLKQTSLALEASRPSDDFATLLSLFEIEVDRLNLCLARSFNNDPDIMQVIFELKSAVIALRGDNVERQPRIV